MAFRHNEFWNIDPSPFVAQKGRKYEPWHDVEVCAGAEVSVDELREAEDDDADADVDEVEHRQAEHQRVEVPLDLDAFPKNGDRLNIEIIFLNNLFCNNFLIKIVYRV